MIDFDYDAATWLRHVDAVEEKLRDLEAKGYDSSKLMGIRRRPFTPGALSDGKMVTYIRHIDDPNADLASVVTIPEYNEEENAP